ncbi:hypothetical protein BdWA1_003335 [Babesia duncani]|uniref:Uncharacterized protein n=1 Tax=Babesia duncani TaxID=323732 RepID=A0AAD9UNB2_9APIC|nr:hypothetical protein BdWA1_003335 [Babesia duncani]
MARTQNPILLAVLLLAIAAAIVGVVYIVPRGDNGSHPSEGGRNDDGLGNNNGLPVIDGAQSELRAEELEAEEVEVAEQLSYCGQVAKPDPYDPRDGGFRKSLDAVCSFLALAKPVDDTPSTPTEIVNTKFGTDAVTFSNLVKDQVPHFNKLREQYNKLISETPAELKVWDPENFDMYLAALPGHITTIMKAFDEFKGVGVWSKAAETVATVDAEIANTYKAMREKLIELFDMAVKHSLFFDPARTNNLRKSLVWLATFYEHSPDSSNFNQWATNFESWVVPHFSNTTLSGSDETALNAFKEFVNETSLITQHAGTNAETSVEASEAAVAAVSDSAGPPTEGLISTEHPNETDGREKVTQDADATINPRESEKLPEAKSPEVSSEAQISDKPATEGGTKQVGKALPSPDGTDTHASGRGSASRQETTTEVATPKKEDTGEQESEEKKKTDEIATLPEKKEPGVSEQRQSTINLDTDAALPTKATIADETASSPSGTNPSTQSHPAKESSPSTPVSKESSPAAPTAAVEDSTEVTQKKVRQFLRNTFEQIKDVLAEANEIFDTQNTVFNPHVARINTLAPKTLEMLIESLEAMKKIAPKSYAARHVVPAKTVTPAAGTGSESEAKQVASTSKKDELAEMNDEVETLQLIAHLNKTYRMNKPSSVYYKKAPAVKRFKQKATAITCLHIVPDLLHSRS